MTGLDQQTGLVDWIGRLALKVISMLSNKTHMPMELCRNPAAFSLVSHVISLLDNFSEAPSTTDAVCTLQLSLYYMHTTATL